jgi:hypothetical protein
MVLHLPMHVIQSLRHKAQEDPEFSDLLVNGYRQCGMQVGAWRGREGGLWGGREGGGRARRAGWQRAEAAP